MGEFNSNAPDNLDNLGEATPLHLPSPEALRRSKWRLRAIPTRYGGCEFRSRLEARWAVFFDTLAIEWRYETEPFNLAPFGNGYLPDFYLPELGFWIEVKPGLPDKVAWRKAYLLNYGLARDPATSQQRVFILFGDIPWPYPKRGNIGGFSASHDVEGDPSRWDLCWLACPTCQRLTIGQINTMSCRDCAAELGALVQDALDVVWSIPEFDKVIDIVPAMVEGAVGTEFFTSGHRMPQLQEAYAKARGMRFEGKERRKSA
jgi:hypothetical protein